MEPTAEKNYSKLEWLFFMVIVPILFISILTIILLWFLDFDVKGKLLMNLNQVPVIEKLIPDQSVSKNVTTDSTEGKNPALEKNIQELKVSLTKKDDQLKQIETEIGDKDVEIAQLKKQVQDLEDQLQTKEVKNQSQSEDWANLAKIYANMNPKNAASILSNLEYQEAASILKLMPIENQSKILEKMDPKEAAKLSTKLKTM